ncbi:MAG: alpha/beta hydrolase [Aquabacterium sp.]|uniref:alpha/beta hydrolase n=1 Tax=Aquabacterium sp. TaxID=1872578 RepID=UPI0025B912E4|nr:alpha/beta hydrolase [Aquabacterium sp.]MBI3384141.1 alpha/beta hydrolase [Aquabacterium sp.]
MAADQDKPQDNPHAARFSALTKMLLDNVKRVGFPPIHTLPVERARDAYKAGVRASELPHAPLARVEDFHIPGSAGPIRARLWANSHEPEQPVLLYLHGGGFVIGSIETCESMCRQIAVQSGAAVVAIDYRLAPEHKYPAGLQDCWAAFTWLVEHGRSMGLNGHRIAVGGDSAGGTLSAAVALMARDAGIPLALQALVYPSVQTRVTTESFKAFSRDTLLSAELMNWFERQTMGEQLDHDWHREPLYAPDHRGLAPAWIGLAECDALTDEGHQYAQKLREAGVPVEVREWPGVIHDFINMGRFLPEARELHHAMAAAVKHALIDS